MEITGYLALVAVAVAFLGGAVAWNARRQRKEESAARLARLNDVVDRQS